MSEAVYEPMSAEGRAKVQSIIDVLNEVGASIGDWTSKVNARERGATIYATFGKKTDVWTAVRWADLLEQCPQKLIDACEKLLAADAALQGDVASINRRIASLCGCATAFDCDGSCYTPSDMGPQ